MSNLIQNGNFGTGSLSPWVLDISSNNASVVSLSSGNYSLQILKVSSPAKPIISQNFTTSPGSVYTLSFNVRVVLSDSNAPNNTSIQVSISNATGNFSSFNSSGAIGWTPVSYTFTSNASNQTLTFLANNNQQNGNNSNYNIIYLDAVNISLVPSGTTGPMGTSGPTNQVSTNQESTTNQQGNNNQNTSNQQTQPIQNIFRFGRGSNSSGNFWYGNSTNFPGFLYKKNVGVGGRRSTKMNPGGNVTCNRSYYLYNKYKPGTGGVGASTTSNRRAKNRGATVCVNNGDKCGTFYQYLGRYDNYTGNPNGYFPYPPPPQYKGNPIHNSVFPSVSHHN